MYGLDTISTDANVQKAIVSQVAFSGINYLLGATFTPSQLLFGAGMYVANSGMSAIHVSQLPLVSKYPGDQENIYAGLLAVAARVAATSSSVSDAVSAVTPDSSAKLMGIGQVFLVGAAADMIAAYALSQGSQQASPTS